MSKCSNCSNENICKYTSDMKEYEEKTKNIINKLDKSPIDIKVTCNKYNEYNSNIRAGFSKK